MNGFCCMKGAAIVLFLMFFPLMANAQFININIDIPTKTGVSEMETSEPIWKPNNDPVVRELESSYNLTLSSSENLLVMASLRHSDYLQNESGSLVKLEATLAYRNDGVNKLQRAGTNDLVIFPMSNSGLLIENMKGNHQNLNAFLMIFTTTEMPKEVKGLYTGEISLKIEYN